MIFHPTQVTKILLFCALCLLQLSFSYTLPSSSRQTESSCTSDGDCGDDQKCVGITFEKCEDDEAICSCVPEDAFSLLEPERCEEDNDCKSNQCVVGVCVPDLDGISATPSADDGACIGAHLLTSFHKTQLVFDSHRKANVLCDQFGSCATPGHIVRWKGEAMMMRTYCTQTEHGCSKQVMLVNSPRYERKLRVESLSPHLSFTAFAARYESVAEELLLRTAVRMGL